MRVLFIFLLTLVTFSGFGQCQWERFKAATDESTEAGKLLTDAIDDNSRLINSWKMLDDAGVDGVLREDIDWLKRVDNWESNGISVAPDAGENKLKLFPENGGEKIAEVTSDGKLLPEKYGSNGSPIGDPMNGYQLIDDAGEIKVKRTPGVSEYSSNDLAKLTDHSDAHVLERHGHDVTDEALKKRATTGIAPDGSRTASGNPPPYSSKFESSDRLKEALNNTGPDSPAWNPPASGNSYAFDYPSDGQAPTPFGYGIPAGGGNSISMNRVKVIYRKEGGVWKLLTMYPQP